MVANVHRELAPLVDGLSMTGDLRADVVSFLSHHKCAPIVGHSMRVAHEAKRLAERWNADGAAAEAAGLLHDISGVVPNDRRIPLAESLELDILLEERRLPMIVHQKLSAVIASEIFNVRDEAVLSAIGCHTTLKANASEMDKIVFVADKIKWDQPGEPPYLAEILEAGEASLDRAACVYLEYLWKRREELPVLHPWVEEAYLQLREIDSEGKGVVCS